MANCKLQDPVLVRRTGPLVQCPMPLTPCLPTPPPSMWFVRQWVPHTPGVQSWQPRAPSREKGSMVLIALQDAWEPTRLSQPVTQSSTAGLLTGI